MKFTQEGLRSAREQLSEIWCFPGFFNSLIFDPEDRQIFQTTVTTACEGLQHLSLGTHGLRIEKDSYRATLLWVGTSHFQSHVKKISHMALYDKQDRGGVAVC